jgi:hypothetical protein
VNADSVGSERVRTPPTAPPWWLANDDPTEPSFRIGFGGRELSANGALGDGTDDATIRMKPQLEPSSREVLAGLVERVTYHNEGNGYCVLRIKARGHRELVTVVGHAAVISAGEWITASGEWVNDRTHGQQYRARFLKTSEPTSLDGIERYLGSGMIRGIGPVYAKKLVRAFGEKVFDTIEAEPERLRGVTGIGPDQESLSRSPIWLSMKRKREDEIKPARHPTDSLVHWEALELYMNHLSYYFFT